MNPKNPNLATALAVRRKRKKMAEGGKLSKESADTDTDTATDTSTETGGSSPGGASTGGVGSGIGGAGTGGAATGGASTGGAGTVNVTISGNSGTGSNSGSSDSKKRKGAKDGKATNINISNVGGTTDAGNVASGDGPGALGTGGKGSGSGGGGGGAAPSEPEHLNKSDNKMNSRKKFANGGPISAKSERRPMPENSYNDTGMVGRNQGNKALVDAQWDDRPDRVSHNGMRTTPIKRSKMVPSNVLSTRMYDEESRLQERSSAGVNNGPQEQPRKVMDEVGANRTGPLSPDLKLKKMARGGVVPEPEDHGQEQEEREDELNMQGNLSSTEHGEQPEKWRDEKGANRQGPTTPDLSLKTMARGGEVDLTDEQPTEEEEIERHASVAAAIMAKRRKMANGGVVDELDPEHADDANLKEGQVDIDENGREMANPMDKRNAAILDDNLDEDMMDDTDQPEDSNLHGRSIESDKHDLVEQIRRKMKLKNNPMVK